MRSSKKYKLGGFTILEVVVVIAILGILVSIVSRSLNRFNDQIHFGFNFTQELSDIQSVRSSIWSLVHEADSIQIEGQILSFFKDEMHSFNSQNGILYKRSGENWLSQNVKCEEITTSSKNGDTYVTIPLKLREKSLNIVFIKDKDVAGRINTYFKSYGREF